MSASQDMAADVLSTAVEGGINHWASVSGYAWASSTLDGGTLTLPEGRENDARCDHVYETHDDDRDLGPLDTLIVARGIRAIADGRHPDAPDHLRRLCTQLARNPRGDHDFDAADADAIVQYTLLGAYVYG